MPGSPAGDPCTAWSQGQPRNGGLGARRLHAGVQRSASHQLSLAPGLRPPLSPQRLQQQNGGVGQHYVGVLWQLLRLRQACNHPLLVKGADGLAAQQPVAAAEVRGGPPQGGVGFA